jgi:predicted permease
MRAKGDWQVASDGSFEAMGERLVRGRWFRAGDRAGAPLVGVINQTMAGVYWPGVDPIGKRFRVGRNPARPWVTVVGVVGDVRHNGLTAQVKEKFYVPQAQWNAATGLTARSLALVVRASGDPLALIAPVRREVRGLDADVPLSDVRTLEDVVATTMATPRFAGGVLGTFALVALVLAAVGVYGVLSYVVSRRTQEIGVRMALGAEAGMVRRMVLAQGLAWGAAGAGAGLALALLGGRLLRSVVYGVSPTDPLTLGAVLATLLAVAVVAAALPAHRATRVDPMTCLKAE